MKRLFGVISLCLLTAIPAAAKTHKDTYNMACSALWPAVRDVLKTSGKYNIIGINSTEFTASFAVGSVWSGKMMNSVVLNAKGAGCEMWVNTAYRGLEHNDAADFKKRVDAALEKLKPESASTPNASAPAKSDPQ
ncbi:MAG TPA: hypothetical protein VFU55_03330 [Terracidiphilus sp.]|nr:hypothetical protein [Terracidiphilus sp.]